MRKLLAVLPLVALLFHGCQSYQMGLPKKAYSSIYIAPAITDTTVPQAHALLTQEVTQMLMQQPDLRIASRDEADAHLVITLTDYNRESSARQSTDTARARAYDLSLTAKISLYNLDTKAAYFENKTIEANVHTYNDSGQQPAEYQNMPALTRKLATDIVNALSGSW